MALEAMRFNSATETGEITNRDGYHQPNTGRVFHRRGCGCDLMTSKGAYRDVSVELDDGRVIHFYHQSPVVVEYEGQLRLSSCGYRTKTTKERINRHLPRGYFVRQVDFKWYLEKPDGSREPFDDGMVIEP